MMLIKQIIKKERQRKFFRNKLIILSFLINLAIILFILFYFFARLGYLPDIKSDYFFILLSALAVLIVNYSFAYYFFLEKEEFLFNLMIFSTLIIEFILLIYIL